jgi:hypothetical protein
MTHGMINYILHIIIQAVGILILLLTLIILGTRFGWFLWMIKKLIAIKNRFLSKKNVEGEKPLPDE